MVQIKSQAEISKRWADSINSVAPAYQTGIQNTQNWKAKAIGGQALYVAKMQQADVLARREQGLNRVDDATWKAAAVGKGVRNIAAGMTAAADKRARNYEPYRAVIESIQLPERTADPMQNLMNRAGPIVQALANKKRTG